MGRDFGLSDFIPIGIAIVGAALVRRFMPAEHLAAAREPGGLVMEDAIPEPEEA